MKNFDGHRRLFGIALLIAAQALMPLTGKGQIPSITVQPESQAGGYGSDVTFTVGAGGAEPLSFHWQKNGVDLADLENAAGVRTPSLHLVCSSTSDVGSYTVVVNNNAGAANSAGGSPVVSSKMI